MLQNLGPKPAAQFAPRRNQELAPSSVGLPDALRSGSSVRPELVFSRGEKILYAPRVLTFLEFFAGGGMARAGLAPEWTCAWANDFSPQKAKVYRANWQGDEFHEGDIAAVSTDQLPQADLAWASFPCQDLSLAGEQSGIGHHRAKSRTRSGTFWPFWALMRAKRPPLIVLENVVGALSSRGGADIQAICSALSGAEYAFGPLIVDAAHWVPQSRERLFIVAVRRGVPIPEALRANGPDPLWHPKPVTRAHASVSAEARRRWIWWRLPQPDAPKMSLENLISETGDAWSRWDAKEQTEALLALMAPRHRAKIEAAQALGRRIVGMAYRRTRHGAQRAEVRFDGLAGCLRTAAGGSSRQIVIEVHGKRVRSRLLSPREAARLQGLPDEYWLPEAFNEAYDVLGDGLAVPAVNYLKTHLLNALAQPAAQLATA